jgi:hypothetical protein
VIIDGTTVMDWWHDQPVTDRTCGTNTVHFTAGERKRIVVEYYDHKLGASIQLKVYGGPTGTQIVPASWLTNDATPLGPGWTFSDGDVSVMGARATGGGISLTLEDGVHQVRDRRLRRPTRRRHRRDGGSGVGGDPGRR